MVPSIGRRHLPDTLGTVNHLHWRDRPGIAHFGPASWQSRLLALLTAIFVRPVLATLTALGMLINRFRPHALQQARLDVIDKPLRVVPALPGPFSACPVAQFPVAG